MVEQTPIHQTPGPKIAQVPKHPTDPAKMAEEKKIDQQMKGSFPASDPPSFSGGNHIIGAPKERESGAATGESPEVKEAEKKVLTGDAKVPETY